MTNKLQGYLLKLKKNHKNCQNTKRLSYSFLFPEGQMHQNQSVYFHVYAVLLKDYNLTLILPTPKVISLCHQYRGRQACTSVQFDQALYCWLTNFRFSS